MTGHKQIQLTLDILANGFMIRKKIFECVSFVSSTSTTWQTDFGAQKIGCRHCDDLLTCLPAGLITKNSSTINLFQAEINSPDLILTVEVGKLVVLCGE